MFTTDELTNFTTDELIELQDETLAEINEIRERLAKGENQTYTIKEASDYVPDSIEVDLHDILWRLEDQQYYIFTIIPERVMK